MRVNEFPLLKWVAVLMRRNALYSQIDTGDPYPIVGGIAQSGDFMNMANSLYNWDQFEARFLQADR